MATTKKKTTAASKTASATKSTAASARGSVKKAAASTRGSVKKAAASTRGTAKEAAASTRSTAKKAAASTRASAKKSAAAPKRRSTKTSTAASRSGGATSDSRQRDAIRVLSDDHREVEELFRRFEKTGPRAHKRRQELVQRITEALSVHASIEEEILYPAARSVVKGEGVLEALEEHHVVKLTLAELEVMDPSNERYGAKVTVLIESVRHHVKEEEGELFPQLRKRFDAGELRALGEQLEAAKRTAPTRPHPEAPDTPPGNIVAQVLTAPLDVAANLNKAAARRVRDIVT